MSTSFPTTIPFELRQMRYVVVAADSPSFRQAAQILRVRQTTLSKRILALEQRLGVTLFERTKRGASPTRAGLEFVRTARRILEEVELLRGSAKAISKGEAGQLAVGLATSLSAGHLRQTLQAFLERFPAVDVQVIETGFDGLAKGLTTRTIDIAVVAGALDAQALKRRHLWPERLMVALRADHRLAGAERIYWPDLRAERFIFTRNDPGPDAVDLLRARLHNPGQPLDVTMQDVSRENLLNMVSMGGFVTLLSETAIGTHYPGLVLREIHDMTGLAHVDFWASWNEDNDNPALQRLFKLIGERYPAFAAAA